MRLDPKYFNPFIAVCAVIALAVIAYSTIRYSGNQIRDFEQNVSGISADTLVFKSYTVSDSLILKEKLNSPIVIHFWSTWSAKSLSVNEFLDDYEFANPELTVIAAAVRDGDEQVLEYINSHPYEFSYVEGTEFYQTLMVPGIPSQILIDRNGNVFDTQVGEDSRTLREKLNRLLRYD